MDGEERIAQVHRDRRMSYAATLEAARGTFERHEGQICPVGAVLVPGNVNPDTVPGIDKIKEAFGGDWRGWWEIVLATDRAGQPRTRARSFSAALAKARGLDLEEAVS